MMGFGDAVASTGPYTPCPEKNETNNILGITLTKFNKFSQLLAQFMLTCQLTKKIIKSNIILCMQHAVTGYPAHFWRLVHFPAG